MEREFGGAACARGLPRPTEVLGRQRDKGSNMGSKELPQKGLLASGSVVGGGCQEGLTSEPEDYGWSCRVGAGGDAS